MSKVAEISIKSSVESFKSLSASFAPTELFPLFPLQAEIGPAALNLTDTSVGAGGGGSSSTSSSGGGGSSNPTSTSGKAPVPFPGGAPSPSVPGARRPGSPASSGPKPPSKGSSGRKGTWRVEDLEGELERKIKMLEKERQAMRKETQGQHEKINQGIGSVTDRVTELEHSESVGDSWGG